MSVSTEGDHMSDRYQEVYRLKPNLYSEGCPVIIEVGVLQKDTHTDSVLVQLKLRNIGLKTIAACKVKIQPYEVNGTKIDDTIEHQYLDLNVLTGDEFASRTPVFMTNSATRKFEAAITELTFNDGTVWKANNNNWNAVGDWQRLDDFFDDPEVVDQYKIDTGVDGLYVPTVRNGLFLCTCGSINDEKAEKCCNCGQSYKALSSLLDKDVLSKHIADRLQKEKEKKLEDEARQETARKETQKNLKRIAISVIVIAAVIAVIFLTKHIIGLERIKGKYNHAIEAYNQGSYLEAVNLFSEIEDYKDTRHQLGCTYAKYSVQLLEQKNYENAVSSIVQLNRYNDKEGELLELSNNAYEKAFSEAIALSNSGDYHTALSIFDVTRGEDKEKYKEYCDIAIELSQSLEKKNLTELYQKVTALNDFNNAEKLIDSNPTLSKIKDWEGTWKATKAKGWGRAADYGALFVEVNNGGLSIISKTYPPEGKWDTFATKESQYDHEIFLIDGKIMAGYSHDVKDGNYDRLDSVIVTGNKMKLESNDTDGYIECSK